MNVNKRIQMMTQRMNAIKNTVYSSVYVVVAFVEQAIILKFLKDTIANKGIYACVSLLTIFGMLCVCRKINKSQKKKIEEKTIFSETNDNYLVECATWLGYFSPVFCTIDWVYGLFEMLEKTGANALIYRWGFTGVFTLIAFSLPKIPKKK